MYVHSDQRTRTQTPDPNAPLYFVIPKQWHKQALDMQGTQRSQYQVVKNNLKTLIVQHLVQIGAKKSAFTCSIEEKPRLHAKLLFAENSAKERSLILENSGGESGIVCVEALTVAPVNNLTIQLVYRSHAKGNNAAASQRHVRKLWDRISLLRNETRILTDEIYGRYDRPSWQFFFDNWDFLVHEAKDVAKEAKLEKSKDTNLDGLCSIYSIKVSGTSEEVEKASSFLKDASTNVLKATIALKRKSTSAEKREAVKEYLERMCEDYARKALAASREASALLSNLSIAESDDDDGSVSTSI